MATASGFRKLALALAGTEEVAHFDRAAFRVARIYATLAADKKSANVKLLPDEQALKIEMMPEAIAAVAGKWGSSGWTTVILSKMPDAALAHMLQMAWLHAQPNSKKGKA